MHNLAIDAQRRWDERWRPCRPKCFSASACCVPQVEMRDMREKEFTVHLREICRPHGLTVANLEDCYPLPQRDQPQRSEVFATEPYAAGCCGRQSLTMTRDWQSNTRAIRAGHTWILEAQPKCLSVSPLVGLC